MGVEGSWIAHHGIEGMKWGVRRFQNKDGSLTSLGLARYRAVNKTARSSQKKLNRLDRLKNEYHYRADVSAGDRRDKYLSKEQQAQKKIDSLISSLRDAGHYEITSKPVKRMSARGRRACQVIAGIAAAIPIAAIAGGVIAANNANLPNVLRVMNVIGPTIGKTLGVGNRITTHGTPKV